MHPFRGRADSGTRTRDPNLGKVVLYQLSYIRSCPNVELATGALKERYAISPAQEA